MADITVTAANVAKGANAVVGQEILGATVTAGQTVYLDTATGTMKLVDANSATALARAPGSRGGIALNGGGSGQPVQVQRGGDITMGATLVVGMVYMASATAGGVCPHADLTTGDYPTILGIARTAAILEMTIVSTNVAKP
jgi:hypothetical protein